MDDINKRIRVLERSSKIYLATAVINMSAALFIAVLGWWIGWWFTNQYASLRIPIPPGQQPHIVLFVLVNKPWLSLLLGLVIGAPHALWQRRHYEICKEKLIQELMIPVSERKSRRLSLATFLGCILVVCTHMGAAGIAYLLRIAVYPAMFSSGAAIILCYPIQREIYGETIQHLKAQAQLNSPYRIRQLMVTQTSASVFHAAPPGRHWPAKSSLPARPLHED